MPALQPLICCYLHPDFLSGFCLSSIGPVKGSHLVGIRAQAGDPWAWHLSGGKLGGRPWSLAGGLAWPGPVRPHAGDSGLSEGGVNMAKCPPRVRHIPLS